MTTIIILAIFIILAILFSLFLGMIAIGYLNDIYDALRSIAEALQYFKSISKDDIRNKIIDERVNNNYSNNDNVKTVLKKLHSEDPA